MKKLKIASYIMVVALAIQLLTLIACGNNITPPPDQGDNPPTPAEEIMPTFDYATYDNTDFSNYSESGGVPCENLPNQEDRYGIADPYVFRFNGKYYLYATTESGTACVKGWKSDDLLHWEPCVCDGLPTGHVSNESCLNNAYAPEVYYFNGKFYMYTSPAGNGHYVLSSDSPEGPFNRVTGNIGMSIDGSVFIDDDEQMYFLNAGGEGIEIRKMNSMSDVSGSVTTLSNTKLGWTEGPMIIKRDGTYFLTYTGVHYLSEGYRVVYSVEQDGNSLTSANAFANGGETPLLLSTEGIYKGLGHSSTVLGPDMDSYYIVYHNMNRIAQGGSWRSMNIDRLIFNGAVMSVDGSSKGNISPKMPVFSSQGDAEFDKIGKKTLSKTQTDSVFTAEFNFVGDNVKCIVSYLDENNYAYVQASFSEHIITFNAVKNGKLSQIAEGTLVNDFNPDVVHTARVAYADGVADVYFDNMRKIGSVEVELASGKIGYEGGEAYYTAFSDTARGYSDRAELKQSGAEIGAQTFLPEGAYKGLTSYKLGEGSEISAYSSKNTADVNFDGAYALKLGNDGDFVRYATYFRDGGNYAMKLTYPSQYGGRKIGVQLNLGEVQSVTLPRVYPNEGDVVTAVITQLNVTKGENLITVYGGTRTVQLLSFSFRAVNGADATDLDEEYGTSNARSLKYIGNGEYSDCVVEVRVRLNGISGNSSAGLILRADNFANSQYDDERSVQGYYIAIGRNEIYLNKYDYNYSKKRLITFSHGKSAGEWLTLKAEIKANTVTVYVDGELLWEYTDARSIATGRVGIYGEGASVTFKQAEITVLR